MALKPSASPRFGGFFLEILTNGRTLGGVFLEALFFGALCYMLSQKDVSLVWPLTSLGFIVTTVSAKFILRERVSAMRWGGVLLIAIGAALTSYSEHLKEQAAKTGTHSVRATFIIVC